MLIYRFYPPGEKNLANLRVLQNSLLDSDAKKLLTQIPVICHDQEPLDFSLYQTTWHNLRDIRCAIEPHNQDLQTLFHNVAWWQWWADQNIASVVLPNMCDKVVLLHSEKKSTEISKFSRIAVPAYWWSHGMISRDWYRFAQHDRRLCRNIDHEFDLDFNIYARAWTGTREYRLTFLSLMVENNLVDNSRITFSHRDNGCHYSNHVFHNSALIMNTALDNVPNVTTSSDSSATYDPNHYAQCAIDVILETLFDDTRWHLTEKTLRPIACGQPFILVGTEGSLQYLQKYGFETFHGLIDETYDSIADPIARLECIIEEMSRIAGLCNNEKRLFWRSLRQIALRNQQRFFSFGFAQQVESELITNLNTAVNQVSCDYQTGRNWANQRRLMTAGQRYNCLQNSEKIYPDIRSDMLWALRSCRSSIKHP